MKRKIYYIFFILLAVFYSAQVDLYSEVNTKEYRPNAPLIFTIVLKISGDDLIQETPLKLPDFSKFNYEYASERNTYIDPVKKIRINQVVYQFVLEPKQTGNVKLGSALVKVNGKMYKTEPIDVIVKEADKKPLANSTPPRNSMYMNMEVNEKEVYKNEPVVAVLRVYSKTMSGFRHLESPVLRNNSLVQVRSIANIDEPIEDIEESDFSSQIVAMYVMIPKAVGIVDLPAADCEFKNHKADLSSNKVKINVKKLPEGAPESFKNAVGDYNLSLEIDDKSVESFEINKAFNVRLKLSGKGNLSPILLPKILSSDEYESFPPKITDETIASEKGIEGSVTAEYIIIPKKKGNILLQTEDFSFFDPKESKYINLGKKTLELTAVTAQDIADAKTTLQKVNEYTNTVLDKVNTPVISTQKLKVEEEKQPKWFFVLSNLLLIGFVVLLYILISRKLKKAKEQKSINLKLKNKPIITIEETERILRNQQNFDLKSHLIYLENLKDDKDYKGFLNAFEILKNEAFEFINSQYNQSLEDYILTESGLDNFEKYKKLLVLVENEKYVPFNDEENIDKILKFVKQVFSNFEK